MGWRVTLVISGHECCDQLATEAADVHLTTRAFCRSAIAVTLNDRASSSFAYVLCSRLRRLFLVGWSTGSSQTRHSQRLVRYGQQGPSWFDILVGDIRMPL